VCTGGQGHLTLGKPVPDKYRMGITSWGKFHSTQSQLGVRDMSAKLEQAISNKQVLVRKIVTGEVVVYFSSPDIKSICLSHSGVVDVFSKRGVTAEAIRSSNLKELVERRLVDII